ncbi:MAG: hypothetical protein RMJ43_06040 [Chloroherpetonaceae bacterium]|nr:hypothetical protein [Chloroherpetonaceae bacterium]
MAQRIFFPYRVASAGAVQAKSWVRVLPNGVQQQIDGYIADFDAGTELKLVRSLSVNIDALRRKCEIPAADRISAVAQWFSVLTELRGKGRQVALTAAKNEVEVTVEISPGLAGGTLVLRTLVILDTPSEGARQPFAAARAGSVLWQDRTELVLEGKGPRFPVEARKFDSQYLSEAGWMLDWRPSSPEIMFMGSVRLLLNERHKAVLEAATAASPDESQKMIVSAITADVGRSLITGMLRNPEFGKDGVRYERGTVGQVVGNLIALTFPGEDLDTVRAQLENEPETFAARLQSRFRLFTV